MQCIDSELLKTRFISWWEARNTLFDLWLVLIQFLKDKKKRKNKREGNSWRFNNIFVQLCLMILVILFAFLLGVPAVPEIIGLPAKTKDVEITIIWHEPQNNGASITQYTVYQRIVSDDGTPRKWNPINVIKDLSDRQVAVKLEKGKNYEFVVTATNRFGESLKEGEKLKKILVLGGK